MEKLRVAAVQISPVFLNTAKTWEKLQIFLKEAVEHNAELILWGETLLPGYPQWGEYIWRGEFQ